jgi:sugar phosphate isomerase/epimerase
MREIVVPTFYSMSQPISKTLEQLAGAGVRLVELHGDAPDTHLDVTDEDAMNALAQVVRGLPLEVHSVHCAFSQPSEEAWDLSQPDEAKRATAFRNRVKVVEASARLGARHVVVHPGAGNRSKERLTHSRMSLVQLAEIARDAGTKLAVENLLPDQLCGSLAEMQSLLEGLDPTVVGFCLDTGHAMLGRDALVDYIRALGNRMLGIHWHSNDNSEDAHRFPDVTHAKWDEFFAALDEVGYDLPVTLEAVPPAGTSLEEAFRSTRAALQGERAPRVV